MKKNVSETSISHYHKPETQKMIRHHEQIVYEILSDIAPAGMTLKEIAYEFNRRTAGNVPDSSLCAPLNVLKAKLRITDKNPKRACKINGIRKKVWSVIESHGMPSEDSAEDSEWSPMSGREMPRPDQPSTNSSADGVLR
jgi:hypothetical protein